MTKNDNFLEICDMVDLQDLPYKTIEVDMQDFPTFTIDEIDLWELMQIPHMGMKLTEGQILEEVMLEEEIEIQDKDKGKIFDSPLPRLYSAKKRVHETKLETCKISTVKVNEIPREEIWLEVSKPTTNPTLHSRWTQILGSKLNRRVKSMRSGKRKVHSMCRPPSKPLDGQNNLDTKARNYSREETANNRPPPKPPYILDGNGEVIGTIENVVPQPRPHQNHLQKVYNTVRV